jgi:antitoxin component YwqK of YwqJK toxin-antitoxin module
MKDMQRVDFDSLQTKADQTIVYQGQPFTGIAVETRSDGTLMCETEFVEGVQNGASREWSTRGQLIAEDTYWNGSKHGICRRWLESGQPASEDTYEYSIKTKHKEWDATGRMIDKWKLSQTDPNFGLLEQLRKSYDIKSPKVSRSGPPD